MKVGRRHEREDVERNRLLDVVQALGARVAQRETRVGQPAGLYEIRFGDPQFLEGCLQPGTVEQRHLHRILDAQGVRQEGAA